MASEEPGSDVSQSCRPLLGKASAPTPSSETPPLSPLTGGAPLLCSLSSLVTSSLLCRVECLCQTELFERRDQVLIFSVPRPNVC